MNKKKLKTLVVEDDAEIRKLISRVVVDLAACDMASDGQEGLDMFVAAQQSETPYDLIILDILMPNLDGREMLSQLRKHELGAGLPIEKRVKVMVVTVVEDNEVVVKQFKEQCDGYLTKPFDQEDLVRAIQALTINDSHQ